jgi:hypothetical protein
VRREGARAEAREALGFWGQVGVDGLPVLFRFAQLHMGLFCRISGLAAAQMAMLGFYFSWAIGQNGKYIGP